VSRVIALILIVACSSKKEPPAPSPTPSAKPEWSWASLPDVEGFDISISAGAFGGPVEQQWSWVSGAICGEDDPFMFATPSSEAHQREGLACGRALIESAGSAGARSAANAARRSIDRAKPAQRFVLDLNRAAHQQPLPLFAIPTTYDLDSIAPLLVGFRREGDTLCRPFESGACGKDPYDKAVAVIGGYVIGGSAVALAEFLAWSDRDRVLAIFPDLATRELEVDLQPEGTTWTLGPRRWLPYSRDEAAAFGQSVRANAKAIAMHSAWGAGDESIVLIPRCSSPDCLQRGALADSFRAYHKWWSSEAVARADELLKENPGPEADCARPIEMAMIEAATKAAITVTDVVELHVKADVDKIKQPGCTDDKQIAEGIARVRAVH